MLKANRRQICCRVRHGNSKEINHLDQYDDDDLENNKTDD